jgi:dodecin
VAACAALALGHDRRFRVFAMNDHIYKKIELVGSSPNGIEDAVNNAVSRAAKTVRNMRWFEVSEMRGHIEDNKIAHWQVTVKIGFTLDA